MPTVSLRPRALPAPGPEAPPVPLPRPLPLHAALLRRSVGALAELRDSCSDCRRTPLVGERVYLYDSSSGERLVCELCRPGRREPPARSRVVRASEGAGAVRLRPGRA